MSSSFRHPSAGRVKLLDETWTPPFPENSERSGVFDDVAGDRSVAVGTNSGELLRVDPDPDDIEIVTHAWLGVAGPHPAALTALSVTAIAAIFAHLVFDLPSWWPYGAGAVAVIINAGLAYWQAGSHRVVTVSNRGVRVTRKARWSPRLVDIVDIMPRRALGRPRGRWSRTTMARTRLWVHRRYHPVMESFDHQYLALYRGWTGAAPSVSSPYAGSAPSGTIDSTSQPHR